MPWMSHVDYEIKQLKFKKSRLFVLDRDSRNVKSFFKKMIQKATIIMSYLDYQFRVILFIQNMI